MNGIDCEIIRDLLPSYADGVCSEKTRELVRAHIDECVGCGEVLARMKSDALKPEPPRAELDGLKRVKMRIAQREMLVLGLLVVFVAAAIGVIAFNFGNVPTGLYYVAGPVLALGAVLALYRCDGGVSKPALKIALTALSLAASVYAVGLVLVTARFAAQGEFPFVSEPALTGPFVSRQLFIIGAAQALIFIFAAAKSATRGISCGQLINVSVMGSCLAFALISLLHRMNMVSAFYRNITDVAVTIAAECAVLAIITALVNRRK